MFILLEKNLLESPEYSIIGLWTDLGELKKFVMDQLSKSFHRGSIYVVIEKLVNQPGFYGADDWLARAWRDHDEPPVWNLDPDITRIELSPTEKIAYGILEKDPVLLDMVSDILKT